MKGRHASPGWSPFWRDILLRTFLILLLIAMVIFIWWLFSEDDLFPGAVTTTTDTAPVTSAEAPSTTSGTQAPTTSDTTSTTTISDTTTTISDTTTTVPVTTTLAPPLGPDELRVKVYNANGVAGVAGRTTNRLEEAGYGTANPDDHIQYLDISRVYYREGLRREAELLRDSLIPDALLEPAPREEEGVDLLVMVGRSYEE